MKDNEPTPTRIDLDGLYKTRRDAVIMLTAIVGRIITTPWMAAAVKSAGLIPDDLYEVVKIGSKWRVKASAKHLTATHSNQYNTGYGIR